MALVAALTRRLAATRSRRTSAAGAVAKDLLAAGALAGKVEPYLPVVAVLHLPAEDAWETAWSNPFLTVIEPGAGARVRRGDGEALTKALATSRAGGVLLGVRGEDDGGAALEELARACREVAPHLPKAAFVHDAAAAQPSARLDALDLPEDAAPTAAEVFLQAWLESLGALTTFG